MIKISSIKKTHIILLALSIVLLVAFSFLKAASTSTPQNLQATRAMWQAMFQKNNTALKQALIAGANPLCFLTDFDKLPIHMAVDTFEIDLVKTLLSQDTERQVNAQDKQGKTPLFYAVGMFSRSIIVEYLLKMGANPRLKIGDQDILTIALKTKESLEKSTASSRDLHEIARSISLLELYLAPDKAMWKAMFKSDEKSLTQALQAGANPLCFLTDFEKLPIHMAVDIARIDLVKALLSKQPERQVNAQDKNGKTPLFYAVKMFNCSEIVEYLLQNGANPFLNVDGKDIFSLAKQIKENHTGSSDFSVRHADRTLTLLEPYLAAAERLYKLREVPELSVAPPKILSIVVSYLEDHQSAAKALVEHA